MEEMDVQYRGIDHYASQGLMRNPFVAGQWGEPSWIPSEVLGESNTLLRALLDTDAQGDTKPVWVAEPDAVDDSFFMGALSDLEFALANDPALNALHAYVPLAAMRIGSTRAILSVAAERLVFNDFNETLAAYVSEVLLSEDPALGSYAAVGPEGLARFAAELADDPTAAVESVFGSPEMERQDDAAEALDARQIDADGLGDDEDSEGELDDSIGVAPGVDATAEDDAEEREPDDGAEVSPAAAAVVEEDAQVSVLPSDVLNYLIEHTHVHLSPVIARAFRTYHERGQIAAAAEFRVTKAPRKTLSALVRLARARYSRVVLIMGEFEFWPDVPEHLRHKIVGALSELRWALGDQARIVFLARAGEAPELEETFASSTRVEWEFSALRSSSAQSGEVDVAVVDRWLAAAAAPGADPIVVSNSALQTLAVESAADFEHFILVAREAVERAASEGLPAVDEATIAAAADALPRPE